MSPQLSLSLGLSAFPSATTHSQEFMSKCPSAWEQGGGRGGWTLVPKDKLSFSLLITHTVIPFLFHLKAPNPTYTLQNAGPL